MINLEIYKDTQRLDNLFKQISVINDTEMQAHWSKYLCVLVSGFLENSFRIMLSYYAERKAAPYISNYVSSQIKGLTNLNNQKIISLLSSFGDEWKTRYETIVEDQEKDAIDSLVANRHLIAHGRSVGISYASMQRYYDNIKKVISKVYENCLELDKLDV